MATSINQTRDIQIHKNPGYMPGEVSFVEDCGTRPMREIIEESDKRAAEILARWSQEDGEEAE